MLRREFCGALAAITAAHLVPARVKSAETNAAKPPKWHDDLRAAHRVAVEQRKPMLIVFGAGWCRFCRKLETETLEHEKVARKLDTSFVRVRLDFDRDAKVAEILEVTLVPSTVVLSPEADLLGRAEGFQSVAEFSRLLRKAELSMAHLADGANGTRR